MFLPFLVCFSTPFPKDEVFVKDALAPKEAVPLCGCGSTKKFFVPDQILTLERTRSVVDGSAAAAAAAAAAASGGGSARFFALESSCLFCSHIMRGRIFLAVYSLFMFVIDACAAHVDDRTWSCVPGVMILRLLMFAKTADALRQLMFAGCWRWIFVARRARCGWLSFATLGEQATAFVRLETQGLEVGGRGVCWGFAKSGKRMLLFFSPLLCRLFLVFAFALPAGLWSRLISATISA
jgi:hypothetical protein